MTDNDELLRWQSRGGRFKAAKLYHRIQPNGVLRILSSTGRFNHQSEMIHEKTADFQGFFCLFFTNFGVVILLEWLGQRKDNLVCSPMDPRCHSSD
jgi:hypothetical protein